MDIQKISDFSQMTDGMIFELTREDIDEGIALDCKLCPVSRALNRRFANNIIVETGFMVILIDTDTDERIYIELQFQVRLWIHDYDQQWIKRRIRVGNPIRLELKIYERDDGKLHYQLYSQKGR